MSEKEKKDIQIINNFLMYCRGFEERKFTDKELFIAMENVGDIIEKQNKELDKDKRIIELMAKEILRLDTEKSKYEYDHAKMWDTENGIKEYFKKKVEEAKNE